MRRLLPVVVLLVFGAAPLFAETAQEIYARGVRAYMSGNIDQAKALFDQVLAVDPDHRAASAYLKRIEATRPAGSALKRRAEKTILPAVEFQDASLSSVLEYLPKAAMEHSPDKGPVNIVQMFAAEYGRKTKISLELSNVPLSAVLDYVAQLGGLTLDYQANAIVVRQAEGSAALQ